MKEFLLQFDIIILGVAASTAAGLFTGVGGVLVCLLRRVSNKMMDAALGAAAGVMLAATSFSLIIPAIEAGGGGLKGPSIVLVGILMGGVFLDLADKFFPDSNLLSNSVETDESLSRKLRLRKTWLFVLAITVHNFPEGMAVGVGFGDGDVLNGLSLAIGIGLQNFPEGLAVALPLLREGYSKWKAFLIALSTGIVEPIGGLIGVSIVNISRPILPLAMSFAAGAMLFVIGHEIIPESQSDHKHSKLATHTLLLGFVVMMFLDNTLG